MKQETLEIDDFRNALCVLQAMLERKTRQLKLLTQTNLALNQITQISIQENNDLLAMITSIKMKLKLNNQEDETLN